MRVVLLGTAADGGVPRWACGCARCAAARDGKAPARTQAGVAVTGNSRDWWLLDASPDLRTQLTGTAALWPGPAARAAPVRGVLLTGAEPAQAGGLAVLRGAPRLTVYAAPPVLTALSAARTALDRYAPWEWRDALTDEGFVLSGGLVVTAYAVGARPPAYLTARSEDPRWSTAYRVEDLATGGVLVYAPALGTAGPAPAGLTAGADCVLLDASARAAAPADVPAALAGAAPAAAGARLIATRLDDANPLLDASPGTCGPEVLPDGAEFVL